MSNQSENAAAIDKFRNELKSLCDDISQIDRKVLTEAAGAGLKSVKSNTPVGQYPPGSGKVGGTMRKGWRSTPVKKTGGGIEKALENPVEYAPYVNDGHRVVNKAGETVGYVEGQHMLEKAVNAVEQGMLQEFNAEVERVSHRHDT